MLTIDLLTFWRVIVYNPIYVCRIQSIKIVRMIWYCLQARIRTVARNFNRECFRITLLSGHFDKILDFFKLWSF